MAKKTSFSKPRTIANPLEIWQSSDGTWEWRVLKKKSDLIWECAVKSPNTFEGWEYGDVHSQTVVANHRTFVDLGFGLDYFKDLVPSVIGTEITTPDASQPQTLLPPERFSFLCGYFTEDGMSYHCPDGAGNLSFFFNTPLEDCPTVVKSQWGIEHTEEEPHHFQINLLVHDQPDDPLIIPFSFDLTNEMHRYEVTQLVAQEKLPFYVLALKGQKLTFYDSLFLTLPDELRRDLAPIIRESLLRDPTTKDD